MHDKLIKRKIHQNLAQTKISNKLHKAIYVKRGMSFLVIFAMVVMLAIILYFANLVASYSLNLPSYKTPFERKLPESTIIYDKNGNILFTVFDSQNRIYEPLSEIPQNMKKAMIAAEDVNFYKEDGINIIAIMRSLLHNIFQNRNDTSLQGASTITQQLVKYTSLTASRTTERKIKEIILTAKISLHYSKNQILEAYLNAVPFGGNNYGVEAAARAYFGKDIKDLDLAQCAFLAGLPQAPGAYSPIYSSDPHALELALDRQKYVFNQMLKNTQTLGLKKQDIENAMHERLVFTPANDLQYPDFSLYVRNSLYAQYTKQVVDTQGLHVYTTLDPTLQNMAQDSIQKGVATILAEGLNAHNASLVAIDATNGNILAMVGSVNYKDASPQVAGNVNMAASPISPGSSVKPFIYIDAFANLGMTGSTIVHDTQDAIPKGYSQLRDFDGKFEGNIPLSQALLESRNIPAVAVGEQVGLQTIYNTLLKVGESEILNTCNPSVGYGPSISIGACDVPLWQHTAAYTILSQDGIRHPAHDILYIKDKSGNIIDNEQNVKSTQVFDPKYVKMMNDILKNYHTLTPVKAKGYIVAGKTGTGQDNKSNTFMGYDGNIAVGVWSGNTDNSFTAANTFGEDTAAIIWNDFMLKALPLLPQSPSF